MSGETSLPSDKRFCDCGCGQTVTQGRRFRRGHHAKGAGSHWWKGGIKIGKAGYILVWIPSHPYADSEGYVRQHRLVMEQKIGRYLNPEEVVHHLNGKTDDNRIDNLQLLQSASEHTKLHYNIGDIPNPPKPMFRPPRQDLSARHIKEFRSLMFWLFGRQRKRDPLTHRFIPL